MFNLNRDNFDFFLHCLLNEGFLSLLLLFLFNHDNVGFLKSS